MSLLQPRHSSGASLSPTENGWRLEIPAGDAGAYRLAQLDDYTALPRSRFPLRTRSTLSLRCRVSEPALTTSTGSAQRPGPSPTRRGELPGTWGFGFWNDPFAISLGLPGMARRLPVLPNACWFFHASAENHLSFSSKQQGLAGNGFLAQTFRAPKIPSLLLAPGVLGFPLLFSKTLSKWIRAIAGTIIAEASTRLSVSPTEWHNYSLTWRASGVTFRVNEKVVFETPISPRGPLGVVIWIDNQFAAWTPEGRVEFGALPQKAASWLEIEQVKIE